MIGHYYYRKFSKDKHFNPSYDATLLPLTNGNFFELLGRITHTCPLNKADTGYKAWKQNNLPLVYFTNEPHRPKGDTANTATGYAMVDVDNLPDVRLECNHPAIVATNYTGNGTHFFIYGVFGDTPQEWQQHYNLYAWEIYNELTKKYGDHQIKLDGHQSQYYWGCYLWGGIDNWVFNTNNDKGYFPAHVALSEVQPNTMYDKDTYWLSGKENANRTTLINCVGGAIVAQRNISTEMLTDFRMLRYTDFLDKYCTMYDKITGTQQEFTWYTDYKGNTYEMGKTNGQKVVLWEPWMQVSKNGNFKIKKGNRRRSIFIRALQTSQFTHDFLNPDHILYDSVLWCVCYCEDGLKFPKNELLEQVESAIAKHFNYKCVLYVDPRQFISGSTILDNETGEVKPMTKNDKIAANARCRKTERIKEVLNIWNPKLTDDENIAEVRTLVDGMNKATSNTIKSYLKIAKGVTQLLTEFPWLADLTFKAGRKQQAINILNKETGETIKFESKQQCMKWLGVSKRTFSKFIDGKTKLNQTFEILKK